MSGGDSDDEAAYHHPTHYKHHDDRHGADELFVATTAQYFEDEEHPTPYGPNAEPTISPLSPPDDSDDDEYYGPVLPPEKRRRITADEEGAGDDEDQEEGACTEETHGHDDDIPRCSICLDVFTDRTSVSPCFHSFCLDCISQWALCSRKCPQCRQVFTFAVVHGRNEGDEHVKLVFPNLTAKKAPPAPPSSSSTLPRVQQDVRSPRAARQRISQRRTPPSPSNRRNCMLHGDEKRRFIYTHHLRAKHAGINPYSKCKEVSPAEFTRNPSLLRKLEPWITRDLKAVLKIEDVEILTAVVLTCMRNYDLRTEEGLVYLQEYLGDQAEHFVHELCCFARSPFNMDVYDGIVQYEGFTSAQASSSRNG